MKIIPKEEKVIFKHRTNGYREYRIPGILSVGNAVLMVCEARGGEGKVNLGDWGDIDIVVLRMEEGKEPQEVLKIGEFALSQDGGMHTYNNPTLIPDGNRTHLIFHKNYEDVFIVTSMDGGITWSSPREITEGYKEYPYEWNVSATGPGHGVQMKNGRLVVPVWFAQGKELENGSREHFPSVAGTLYSDDHGETWHAGALVEADFPIVNANETCAAEMADGRLLVNFRNMNQEKRRVLGVSPDGGQSYEQVWLSEELPDPGCFGGMAACGDGVLFANCDSVEKRTNVTVKFSDNGGKNWDTVWEVDPIGGYVDIAVCGEDVYVFYERFLKNEEALVLKTGKLVRNTEN